MFTKYKNIILIVIIAVVVFFLYKTFLGGDGGESNNSLLKTQTATGNAQDAAIGKEFLSVLLELRSLDLDESVFGDRSFIILRDFSQEIRPQPSGRANPFLDIGNDPVTLNLSDDDEVEVEGATTTEDGA